MLVGVCVMCYHTNIIHTHGSSNVWWVMWAGAVRGVCVSKYSVMGCVCGV